MIGLADIRKDFAEFLGGALGITGIAGPQTNINPPCVVTQPHPTDDYLEPASVGFELVRFQALILCSSGGDPSASLDALERHLDKLRPTLQWGRGASGLKYTFGTVSAPGQFTAGTNSYLGVAMTVTTQRPVDRPEEYP